MALYHLPRYASGNRLREIMGLTDAAYEDLEKVNLCEGRWSVPAARAAARALLAPDARYVLLGAKVRAAFAGPAPFERHVHRKSGNATFLGLPHPSGRNLIWNDPSARRRAREALRALAPEVPWGRGGAEFTGRAKLDGR